MGKVLILNGSPRAPKSNSRRYAEIFSTACKLPSDCFNILKTNHAALCQKMSEYSDVLLVFPLYADSLPVGLLNFLKYLEANPPERKPVVSVLINLRFSGIPPKRYCLGNVPFLLSEKRLSHRICVGFGKWRGDTRHSVPLHSCEGNQETGKICR